MMMPAVYFTLVGSFPPKIMLPLLQSPLTVRSKTYNIYSILQETSQLKGSTLQLEQMHR